MAQLAREGSRNKRLLKLVNEVCGENHRSAHLDCWDDFVRRRFKFRDEFREVLRSVEFTLNELDEKGRIEGDCDCVSIFLSAGAIALGFSPVRFLSIRTDKDNPYFTHVFVEVFDGSRWRRLDPTVKPSLVDEEIYFDSIEEII